MCNVIYRCHEYAKTNDRILIIDTKTGWFNDDINEYISFNSPYIYKGDPTIVYNTIKNLSIYPSGLDITAMELPEKRKNINELGFSYYLNEHNLSYDLNKPFQERIMVYSMYKVGQRHFNDMLRFCSLSYIVKQAYWSARSKMPAYYVGVHVRNTDYVSDVPDFIKTHEKQFSEKAIFVATDNKSSLELFKEKYGANVFSFTDITENGGKPLHEGNYRNKEESRKYNIDTFVDILLLATSNEYYYSSKESGFSLAISELRSEEGLLKRLL